MPSARCRRCQVLPSLLLLLALAGCSSGPDGPPGTSAKPRGLPPAPTPMAGRDSFFAGRILAEVSVGTDGLPEVAAAGSGGSGGHRRHGGGAGALNVSGSGGEVAGAITGRVPFGGGGSSSHEYGARGGEDAGPRPVPGGMGRPVMIHLRFTNQGAEAVTLRIDIFTSALGNFAVRPEKLVLEPGQSLETEPMTSQLAGSLAEADVTLALRIGMQPDKRTFPLQAVTPPTGMPATPAK